MTWVVPQAVAVRDLRPRLMGVVTSDKASKTRKVTFEYLSKHPKYKKYVKRNTVIHVHDENNASHVGDVVEIMSCRPISRTKSHRLVRIVSKSIQIDTGIIDYEYSRLHTKNAQKSMVSNHICEPAKKDKSTTKDENSYLTTSDNFDTPLYVVADNVGHHKIYDQNTGIMEDPEIADMRNMEDVERTFLGNVVIPGWDVTMVLPRRSKSHNLKEAIKGESLVEVALRPSGLSCMERISILVTGMAGAGKNQHFCNSLSIIWPSAQPLDQVLEMGMELLWQHCPDKVDGLNLWAVRDKLAQATMDASTSAKQILAELADRVGQPRRLWMQRGDLEFAIRAGMQGLYPVNYSKSVFGVSVAWPTSAFNSESSAEWMCDIAKCIDLTAIKILRREKSNLPAALESITKMLAEAEQDLGAPNMRLEAF